MKTTLVLLIGLLAVACAAHAKTCSLSSADAEKVRNLPSQYRQAWLSSDAESAVMALMSESATILPHHGVKPLSGHLEIRSFWFPRSTASFQLLELRLDPVNVDGCRDVAYVWGTQSIEWKMKEDARITSNSGTFLLVARKHKNKWLIERLMWDDPPNQTR